MTTPAFMLPLPSPLAEIAAASLHAAGLAVVVWLVCTAAGRRLPAGWRAALWLLVFVRLALPAVPQVGWHPLAALRPDAPPTPRAIAAPPRSLPEIAAAPDGTVEQTEAPPVPRGLPTRPAVPAPAVPGPAVTLPRFLLVAWAAGFVVCLTRFGLRWRRLRRMAGRCPEVTDPAALDLWDCCRAEAGVRRAVRLLVAPPGRGPATGGCVRPTAFVSADLLAGPSADLRTVFLHELAHVRRFDVPADWAISLLCCAHWFNPAAWWAAARWRAARESACDDAVLTRLTPADRPAYGRLVLRVSLDASSRRERAAPTFGVGFGASPLPERIAVIASHTPPDPPPAARVRRGLRRPRRRRPDRRRPAGRRPRRPPGGAVHRPRPAARRSRRRERGRRGTGRRRRRRGPTALLRHRRVAGRADRRPPHQHPPTAARSGSWPRRPAGSGRSAT